MQKFNQVIIIMGVHTDNNKLAKITEPKTIHFDLSKNFDNNVKYETDFYHKTQWTFSWTYNKNGINQLLFKHKHANFNRKHSKQ